MKFRVIHTAETYATKDKVDKLKKLGFKFDRLSDAEPVMVHNSKTMHSYLYYPHEERKVECEPGDYDLITHDKDWVSIEINSLEELMKFAEEYGEIIITPKSAIRHRLRDPFGRIDTAIKDEEIDPIIEIYDDYKD